MFFQSEQLQFILLKNAFWMTTLRYLSGLSVSRSRNLTLYTKVATIDESFKCSRGARGEPRMDIFSLSP